MEDAHETVAHFDGDPSTSFFAVYDGHGGMYTIDACCVFIHGGTVGCCSLLLICRSFSTSIESCLRARAPWSSKLHVLHSHVLTGRLKLFTLFGKRACF